MLMITGVTAGEILDSRGYPTVRARVSLAGGVWGEAAVPAGASTGQGEALELRDGGARYQGRGVLKAVDGIFESIAPALLGVDATRQTEIDTILRDLDGTPDKSRLGANAILAVSLAVARAAAGALGIPLYRYLGGVSARLLPVPQLNIINGGVHAGNNLNIQEFMIVPAGAPSFSEGLSAGSEVYHCLGDILRRRRMASGVGDEGGYCPDLKSHTEALDLMMEAIEGAGYRAGRDVYLAIDAAASEFCQDGVYRLGDEELGTRDMIDMYSSWIDRYPLVSIEDGLAEDDWQGWGQMTQTLGSRVQLVGDDLFVTNTAYLARGIAAGAANAMLVKPNQIGTLTETLQAIQMAHAAGYSTIISHRSGETEDTFIADLSVATASGQIKAGAPARTERTAKYNRLLAIQEQLGAESVYGGPGVILRPGASQS